MKKQRTAVFLGFGFVFAQSQGLVGMLLRESLAKTQKSALRIGYSFSSKALAPEKVNAPALIITLDLADFGSWLCQQFVR